MPLWIDPNDVLDVLLLAQASDNLDLCIDAAEAQIRVWREDIVWWQGARSCHPDAYLAGVRLAALLYQHSATPEGFAGFSDAGGFVGLDQSQMTEIRLLARAHRPKVR